MKETERAPNRAAYKMPLLTEKDATEFETIKTGLIAKLKKLGSYEPEIDDLHIEAIAKATVYMRHSEALLDSKNAGEETYSRVSDAQAKMRKMIENALRELAVTRRERILSESGKATQNEFTKALLEALKNRPK
jgi:hypothetical protein